MSKGLHDDFKIIVDGKELSFPIFRIILAWIIAFIAGGYFL